VAHPRRCAADPPPALLTGRNHTRNSRACISKAAVGFLNASGAPYVDLDLQRLAAAMLARE
jgi:hypothetical protein